MNMTIRQLRDVLDTAAAQHGDDAQIEVLFPNFVIAAVQHWAAMMQIPVPPLTADLNFTPAVTLLREDLEAERVPDRG